MMTNREIRLEHLFNTYGKERFLNWCRLLKIFRFYKSHPYPDDLVPDRFLALIEVEENTELKEVLGTMKVKLIDVNLEKFLLNETQKVYSGEAVINSNRCFVSINKILKTISLEVSGNDEDRFTLDDTSFQRAKTIDDFLHALSIEFVSSPYADDYYITPEYYPEVWK